MDEARPFLFYAVESPIYPARYLGGYMIREKWWPIGTVEGTAVMIGGGEIRADERILPEGGLMWREGEVFAERLVSSLVKPHDGVTVAYDLRSGSKDWLERMTPSIGFRIKKTPGMLIPQPNGRTAWTPDAVICVGKGRNLRALHWLEGTGQFSSTILIAGGRNQLAEDIVNAADGNAIVVETVGQFWVRVREDLSVIEREIGGYDLIASIGGHECWDVFINMAGKDTSEIPEIVKEAAAGLDVTLFDAGTITAVEESGYFVEDEVDLSPIPQGWRRVT